MADESLVKGAAVLGATKGPVGTGLDLGFKGVDNTQALAAKKANEQKVAATTAAINSHMARLSSNVDLTGYTNEEQKAFKNFLNAQRSAYAYAANEAARINDASDPDYQFYVDSMNAINNSIVNLKAQSTAYQEGKIDFAQSNEADLWSAGNDPESNGNAQLIFGLGETRAPMKIDNNGNLGFEVNGNTIMYKDYEAPFMKDYKTAKYIADTSNTLYNAHSKLSDAKRHQIRISLEQQLTKPESLKSIISADFTLDGLDFSNIVFNPEDIAGTRKQLIDAIMQGYEDVANTGYSEKKGKNNDSIANDSTVVDASVGKGGKILDVNTGLEGIEKDNMYFKMQKIKEASMSGLIRSANYIPVEGSKTKAWLYTPAAAKNAPGEWKLMSKRGNKFVEFLDPAGNPVVFNDPRDWYLGIK